MFLLLFIFFFINKHIETRDKLVYLSIHSHYFIFKISKVLFISNIRRVMKLIGETMKRESVHHGNFSVYK